MKSKLSRMTRLQAAFLVLGLILSIVWIGLAWENLTKIIELNPDLFLGLLASGVIVSFREAFAQTITEQIKDQALDMLWDPEDFESVHQKDLLENLKNKIIATIRDIEGFVNQFDKVDENFRDKIEHELKDEVNNVFDNRLKNHRVYEIISLLNRDIEAAYQRLGEYYDENADKSFFHRSRGQLQIVMQDLDEVEGNAKLLNHVFGDGFFEDERLNDQPAIFNESINYQKEGLYEKGAENGNHLFKRYNTELETISRALAEGLNRRDQLDNYLRQKDLVTEKKEHSHLKDLFSVISSDLTKAHKQLIELQSEYRALEDFEAHLVRIQEYVDASLERAENFFSDFIVEHHEEETHEGVSIDLANLSEENFVDYKMPKIFYVMVKDLSSVSSEIGDLLDEIGSDLNSKDEANSGERQRASSDENPVT